MENMTSHTITAMVLSLGILLGVARMLGELALRFRQPAVLGELLAWVLLGARIEHLKESLVAVGISADGIDFDAPDDRLANVIFLILTPIDDSSAQLDITSEIARTFRDQRMTDVALRTKNFTDFLALMRVGIQWKPKA